MNCFEMYLFFLSKIKKNIGNLPVFFFGRQLVLLNFGENELFRGTLPETNSFSPLKIGLLLKRKLVYYSNHRFSGAKMYPFFFSKTRKKPRKHINMLGGKP